MEDNQQPIVAIYHTPCNDGMTGAWAVKRANPNAELRPAMHGKPFPLDGLAGRDVVFVDICPKKEDLLRLVGEAKSVLVLDHHKTAQADLEGVSSENLTVVFDMDRSGAGIAWDFYNVDEQPRPWLVDVVEDNDLWRFANPNGLNTKALIEAIRSVPSTIQDTELLASLDPKTLEQAGEAILRFKTIQVEQSVEFAQEVLVDIGGGRTEKVFISNVPFFLCSDVANALAKKNQGVGRAPLGITYYMTANGKWALSFRSLGDYDCSVIAKHHGGGGHKNASGANVTALPW